MPMAALGLGLDALDVCSPRLTWSLSMTGLGAKLHVRFTWDWAQS